jgi:hypothetical protein
LVHVIAYETAVTKKARTGLADITIWFDGSHDAHNNPIP